MIGKYFLVAAVLGIGGLLIAPLAVQARGGGGGHGGGGHGGGGHGGGMSHGGGHYGGGHYGGGHYGGGGGFYGGGLYGGGLYGGLYGGGLYGGGLYGGYGYGSGYYSPYYGNSYYSAPSYAYPQAAPYNNQPAPVTDDYAHIRVLVPDPQAKVWFDGAATSSTGTDRIYHSPALAAGSYSYRIRASWMQKGEPVTQEAVVNVTPGQTAVVDFTRPVQK